MLSIVQVAALLSVCIATSSGNSLTGLFELVKGDPSVAITRGDDMQQLVMREHNSTPGAHELLGMVEYYRGDVMRSFHHYMICAELGGYSEDFTFCVLNSALLLRKRDRNMPNYFLIMFTDFQRLLTSAPEYHEPWTELVGAFQELQEQPAAGISTDHYMTIMNMLQSTVSIGLAFHPTCSGLLYVQAALCGRSRDFHCSIAYFNASMHNRHMSVIPLFNSSYYERVCLLNIEQASVQVSKVGQDDLGNPMLNADRQCFNQLRVPDEFLTLVTHNSTATLARTYMLEIFRLSRLINTGYWRLIYWESFVRIHMQVVRTQYLDAGRALTDIHPLSVLRSELFHHYLQIGISLFPKYFGLLFLQGLQYFNRHNDQCAVLLLRRALVLSGFTHKDLDASVVEDVQALSELLLVAAMDRLTAAGENYSEDGANKMCFPLRYYDGASLSHGLPEFEMAVDAESLRLATQACNSAMEPIRKGVLRPHPNMTLDRIVQKFSDADFVKLDAMLTLRQCRVVQIGCNHQYCVRPGWVVVDALESLSNYAVMGVNNLSTAFNNQSVHILYVSHVFEHVPKYMVNETLAEWRRVLVPGGLLLLGVPDMDAVTSMFGRSDLTYDDKLTLLSVIYGGGETNWNVHYAGYFFESLREMLLGARFCDVRRVPSFGLFNDGSEFDMDGRAPLSLNMIAAAC